MQRLPPYHTNHNYYADWAGDQEDRRSTSGYFFQMAGGPVSWKSRKQECVALSTAEAEYIALSSAAQETVWIRRLISELGTELKGPKTLMEDNQAAIVMAKNPQYHGWPAVLNISTFVTTSLERKSVEETSI